MQFARAEGIIPGPEPAHAVASAMLEAERARESGEEKVIVFNLSGHGHFDMAAYQDYLSGDLVDYEYPEERVAAAMENVPVSLGRRLSAQRKSDLAVGLSGVEGADQEGEWGCVHHRVGVQPLSQL